MRKTITLGFSPGDIVVLKTDREHAPRIITRITIGPDNGIEYGLRAGASETTWHSDLEISGYMEKRRPGFRVAIDEPKKSRA